MPNTIYCPICGKKIPFPRICTGCGYDSTRDYEMYPTLMSIPENTASISTRRLAHIQKTEPSHTDDKKTAKKRVSPITLAIPIIVCIALAIVLLIAVFPKQKQNKESEREKQDIAPMIQDQSGEPEKKKQDIDSGMASDTVTFETDEQDNDIVDADFVFGDHYYMIFNDSMTWSDARLACEEMKGHLVSIVSAEEQEYIKHLIESYGSQYHYWLGGTDEVTEGTWEWITGETWAFENWEPGQPNNAVKHDPDHGQDYLEIQVTRGDNKDEEYLTWTDVTNDGVSPGFEEAPEYNSTQYYGYICEWDDKESYLRAVKNMDKETK